MVYLILTSTDLTARSLYSNQTPLRRNVFLYRNQNPSRRSRLVYMGIISRESDTFLYGRHLRR